MSDEILNQWNIENQTNSQELKDRQRDKDFDDIIKMVEKMTPREQMEFVEKMRQKDPVFQELYWELRAYFEINMQKLEEQEQMSSDKNNEAKEQSEISQKVDEIFSQIESRMSFLEKNKDFSNYVWLFESKDFNWINQTILKWDVVKAYWRFSSNKEPLMQIVANTPEWKKAYNEMQYSLKYTSNMPFAPENQEKSIALVKENYNKKLEELANKFVELLENTNIWKQILAFSLFNSYDEWLKTSINKSVYWNEWENTKLTENIRQKTHELNAKINEIQEKLNKQLKDFKNWQQDDLRRRDPLWWDLAYQKIPWAYEWFITEEIDKYSKEVWAELIKQNAPVIKEWWTFYLPLWNWEEVVLDFSNLWNIEWKSQEEVLKIYNEKFSSIYKNWLIDKLTRELTSKKWLIDVWWVVLSWWVTMAVDIKSWWIWIPASALIFTATENAYRAWMYEFFNVEWWAMAWIWIDLEKDSITDIIWKKWFELFSNWVLFWLFKATWIWKDAFIKAVWEPKFLETLAWKISTYWVKTWVEASFFTYYTIASNNLIDAVSKGWNSQEILESFVKVWTMDDLIKLFIYNMGFITLVKWWGAVVEKWLLVSLNAELNQLKQSWIYIVEWRFYKWNEEVKNINTPEIQRFIKVNQQIARASWDTQTSWNAWKTVNRTQINSSDRFNRLEDFSKETSSWWIKQAVWDNVIWQTLESSWLQGWKWVWEWLLKKSWFSDEEVALFRDWKLKWEKANEVSALNEMNRAMEVVYREYREWLNKFISWKSLEEAYPNVSKKLLPKLGTIITKELELTLPVNNK